MSSRLSRPLSGFHSTQISIKNNDNDGLLLSSSSSLPQQQQQQERNTTTPSPKINNDTSSQTKKTTLSSKKMFSSIQNLISSSSNTTLFLQSSFGYDTTDNNSKKKSVRFAQKLVSTINIIKTKTREDKRNMFYSYNESQQIKADYFQAVYISRQPNILNLEDFGESICGLEDMKSEVYKKESVRYRSIYVKTIVKEYRKLLKKKQQQGFSISSMFTAGISSYDDESTAINNDKIIYDLSCRHTQYHREEAVLLAESDAVEARIVSKEIIKTTTTKDNKTTGEDKLDDKNNMLFSSSLSKEDINTRILSDLETVKEKIQELKSIIIQDSFSSSDDENFGNLILFLRSCHPRIKDLIDILVIEDGLLLDEDIFMECLYMNDQLGKILSDIDSCL